MAKTIPLLFLKADFPPAKPAADREAEAPDQPEPESEAKPESRAAKPKAPAVGDLVKFKAGAFEGKGKVVKVGDDGVTIEDAEGREHGVHWDELLGIKRMGEKPEPEPDADPDTIQDADQNQMRDRSVGRSQGS